MAANKTCLSAGEVIVTVLNEDAEVSARINKIYPVVSDESTLPYIVYRRAQLSGRPVKAGRVSDTVSMELTCYTAHYTEGVELAEAVRAALEGRQAEVNGLTMRSCTLEDAGEDWQDDAFVQQLVFNIKIG